MIIRLPLATYRLQFNKDFTLPAATAIVPYLQALGVSDVYASPFLAARPGSNHGYDVIDHSRLNPELGTDDDLTALSDALRAREMSILMDVVPNHMCIATSANRWWNDVLENGRSSPFARFFDIDWHPPKPELHEKVLLPVLGEQYGRVLENQQIAIEYEAGAFFARYYQSSFPIGPRTIRPILEPIVASMKAAVADDDPDLLELESILTAIKHLPTRWDVEPEQVRERQREKEIVKKRIASLVESSDRVRGAVTASLMSLNGEKGNPRSFDLLEALLGDQAYRLSFWGVAAEEINYRRFFDINDLAAIRVEEAAVLAAVHEKAFQLVAENKVTGLRIDHVDGLLDPARYLRELQAPPASGERPNGPCGQACFVVVEKILTGDETLPANWPVQGTTGYEFLNVLNGLFVDGQNARVFTRFYERLTGHLESFDDLVYRTKKLILQSAMSSELFVLASRLDRISEQHRWSRDFTMNSLHHALGEVIACFPVYRSYVQVDSTEVSASDRLHIQTAIRAAKRRNRSINGSIFDFIGDILLLQDPEGLGEVEHFERRDFLLRLQQLTGPVMAKGMEDTAFYRFFPLASLNEVGGHPAAFGVSAEGFHVWSHLRQGRWPHSLSATATHDTKRGEDVRARLNVLSEIPRDWQLAVRRWQRMNRPHKVVVEDASVPGPDEEYLLYQTLVGTLPFQPMDTAALAAFADRICAYMNKALKESKQHTSWINVNEAYERAVERFVRGILGTGPELFDGGDAPAAAAVFLRDLRTFTAEVARHGIYNSLSQVVLKITAPGIPDFYQGTELWDLSLVDPDNRRPVDYVARRALLERLRDGAERDPEGQLRDLFAAPFDGAIKLALIQRTLRHRQRHRRLFETGQYLPLFADGERRRNVIAFARVHEGDVTIVAAARFLAGLRADGGAPIGSEAWGAARLILDAALPPGRYRDVFTGRVIGTAGEPASGLPLASVFATLPVAVLERAD